MVADVVRVFTRDGCQRCKQTIRLLTALGHEPEVLNISHDAVAANYLEHTEWLELPVVEVIRDGEIIESWSGNRPKRIEALK